MNKQNFFIPPLSASSPNPQAVFTFTKMRVTLLTSRFVRMEISPSGQFEDRPSQAFWNRNQPLPEAEINYNSAALSIDTQYFQLSYLDSKKGDFHTSPSIKVKENGRIVHIDTPNPGRFAGTTRTLDETNGFIRLQPGFISKNGWVQIEDTNSLVFNADGWLEPRPDEKGYRDLYFLISASDYKAALQDYQKISGFPPLLPRAFLGNWWSRYWEYTQEDILHLVERFQQERIPLSTFIIDMDWHITKTGNQCSGWTGFSWNRDLFPDPQELIHWLHEQNLITALNLHPAEGIHPHEDQYPTACQVLGLDPTEQKPIPFDIADPNIMRVYFDQVLHPLEAQGVDFWWLDWQQGDLSKLPGLDPLWWLNHLHFYDLAHDAAKRPIIFSRWGGPGNHRYPIGFSGDTVITWQSLAFQPWFTATAANSAYGWWSHDIGGHMRGMEDAELYTRWVQFGLLSPIFRLHCTKDPFIQRHPWGFDAQTLDLTRSAMQLRHALVPYLYSMARRNEQQGLPLITPLYYDWPGEESAALTDNQYLFGSGLMAAPITSPMDSDTRQARRAIWFPPGEWFDFFTGVPHSASGWQIGHYDIADIPLFARAGSIIPLNAERSQNGTANPKAFDLLVFPGADGQFTLYEDDGSSQQYLQSGGCTTEFSSRSTERSIGITISPARGETQAIPQKREYRIHFRGVGKPDSVTGEIDGSPIKLDFSYDPETRTTLVEPVSLSVHQQVSVKIRCENHSFLAETPDIRTKVMHFLRTAKIDSVSKWKISTLISELEKDIRKLNHPQIHLSDPQKVALIEIITGVGAIRIEHPQHGPLLVLTNPAQLKGFKCNSKNIIASGQVKKISKRKVRIGYFGLVNLKI